MESIVLSRWVYLVFLDPILRILCFVIGVSLPINTYILLAFILCFVAKLRSGMIFCFLCYCISEILFYPGDGVRQYMLSYAVSIMAVFSFIKVGYRSFSSIDWRAIDVAMVRCFFVIGIGQLVSIAFKGFNMSMAFAQSNVYGALIPHEFAYYNLIFSLYFIHRKKNVLGLVALFLCVFLGRRTTLLLALVNFVIFLNNIFHGRSRIVFLSVLFVLFFYVGGYIVDILFSGLALNDLHFDSFFEENSLMNRWTRGRNLIWSSGIEAISGRSFLSADFWFGFGPRTSVDYNEKMSGVAIWMHNDFLDILFCLGVIGFFIYVLSMLFFSVKCGGFVFFIYWIIMAFFNGFMFYNSVALLFVFALIALNMKGVCSCVKAS